jgi:adenylosuccinate lyase
MASGVFDSILLRDSWGTEELRRIFSDENRVECWFAVEAALAREQAAMGIVPREAAEEIAAKAHVANVDLHAIAAEIAVTKHPLVPALRALQRQCRDGLGEWLHYGPTTQDVIDTGMMLQLKAAHAVFLRELRAVGRAVYRLAERHRETAMAGRTHGIQALPITFGHKCAVWLRELARHHERLTQAAPRVFVGGLVGAVGTMASFGPRAMALEERVMRRLNLGLADISWQPARDRFAEYAAILGLLGGTLGKIALEVWNLQRTELGEAEEPFNEGKVGSSTMPHKRNPMVCEAILTVARALRHNVALVAEAMGQQHERDSAVWKTEWKALPECCLMLGFLLARSRDVLEGLVVDERRMRANLDLLGGFLLSERVMFALAPRLGKQTAHEVVYEAAMQGQQQGTSFAAALAAHPRVKDALPAGELDALLDPTTYVGLAPQLVDRALAITRGEGWLEARD